MKTIKFIGAALALTLSTAAFAADCCAEMDCCKHEAGKPCCCEGKHGEGHSGHDQHDTPAPTPPKG